MKTKNDESKIAAAVSTKPATEEKNKGFKNSDFMSEELFPTYYPGLSVKTMKFDLL
jgi:hypothetical protein